MNMKGSLDWEKEGHSVRRHESSRKRHPKCVQGCPRNFKLKPGKGKGKESNILDNKMDVDPPILLNAADPGGPSNIPVAGPSNVGNGIIINLLFIYLLTN